MLFFDLLKYKGYPIRQAKSIFDTLERKIDLNGHQEDAKWIIYNYHKKYNKNYGALIGDSDIDSWESIPILDKKILGQDYKHWVPTFGDRKQRLYTNQTSGSTGQPFGFAKDSLSHTLTWLLIQQRYKSIGVSLDGNQARIFGQPIDALSRLKEFVKDTFAKRVRFPVLDFSDSQFNRWVNKFRAKRFNYIYGYAYPIITFSKFLIKNSIVLKDVCPSLKGCIVTSEMCSKEEREVIKSAMGIPVANEYGSAEFGIIGFSSNEDWLVSDELIYLEIVDEQGNVLPDGELGEIVCTSLFNKGTPFIRYKLGDLGIKYEKEGRTYLKELFGRQEDVILLPDGKKSPGDTLFYYVIKEFNRGQHRLEEYKFIQKTVTEFKMLYVGQNDLPDFEIRRIEKIVARFLHEKISIVAIRKDIIDRSKRGKFKRYVCEIDKCDE